MWRHLRCVLGAVIFASFVGTGVLAAGEPLQPRTLASVGGEESPPPSSRRTHRAPPSSPSTAIDAAVPVGPTTRLTPLTMSAESGDQLQLLVRRAVIATLLAGALAAALFFSMGRRQSHGGQHGSQSLKLLSTLSLAPRCSVSLVRAEGQTVLVARDASGVKEMLLLPRGFDSYMEGHPEPPTAASILEVRDHG